MQNNNKIFEAQQLLEKALKSHIQFYIFMLHAGQRDREQIEK